MLEKLPDGWTAGQLIGVAAPLVVEVLDCSHWESDIPDDQWCVGELIGVCAPLEVVHLDCSHWEQEPVAPPVEPATGLRPPSEGGTFSAPAEKPAG